MPDLQSLSRYYLSLESTAARAAGDQGRVAEVEAEVLRRRLPTARPAATGGASAGAVMLVLFALVAAAGLMQLHEVLQDVFSVFDHPEASLVNGIAVLSALLLAAKILFMGAWSRLVRARPRHPVPGHFADSWRYP